MPEIRLTEEQLERLEAVTADVEAAYVGRYGRATPTDAIDYLLDTYTPPSATVEADAAPPSNGDSADGGADETDEAEETEADTGATESASTGGSGSGGGGSPLTAAAALLEENDDVWRKSGGDAPYEVDLPDGTTEAVRTKGDVKRLLFKHYR
ncbi:hypothetical protein N0B31_17100 [Salinirubellus salinus]|uniref:Uncharacterized protein n=1 Tax=Salinirubellus salinus TaxID=1364945 RepID=A0A9E7UAB5_9EURY|nr:hypothetical protein [Salinirubellus salinus]UWM53837.1 hypothetical protein N0B31_17100 [Salinirubellus salinus]